MPQEIINICQLSYTLGKKTILNKLNGTVFSGAFLVVLGENGAGKTTLLDLMMGFRRPSNGTLTVLGEEPLQDHWWARQRITYLSEKVDIPGDWSVQEFITFHQHFYPQYSKEIEDNLLKVFRIDSQQRVGNLSAGQIRRAQIVAGLAIRPELIVIDEISAVLDIVGRRKLMQILWELCQSRETTVVFATNILEDIVRYATHVLLLRGGQALAFDQMDDFLDGHAPEDFSQLIVERLEPGDA